MSTVSDILRRKGKEIISVKPDLHVLDALKIMADKNIGSVVVLEEDKYCGLMTERDYARKVILKGKSSGDTKVADIMSADLPAISPQDTVEHCMELMSEKNIRYLPVFENDRLCGLISINDVVKETILGQQRIIEHLHNYIQS
jgi:CBS domain-containing protein